MLFIVRFVDRAERLEVRDRFLSAHLEWLEQHQATILAAGSLRSKLDRAPVGALWLVEAARKTDVEELLATDPFWVQGLRQSYEILHWSKAFPERRSSV